MGTGIAEPSSGLISRLLGRVKQSTKLTAALREPIVLLLPAVAVLLVFLLGPSRIVPETLAFDMDRPISAHPLSSRAPMTTGKRFC